MPGHSTNLCRNCGAVLGVLDNPGAFSRAVTASYPKAMFVLLPLFALLTNLAYRRTAPRYPAHLYFALHEHAAGFGALALAKVFFVLVTLGLVAYTLATL